MLYDSLRFFGFFGFLVPIYTLVWRIPIVAQLPDNILIRLFVTFVVVIIILFLIELAIAFSKGIVELFEKRG